MMSPAGQRKDSPAERELARHARELHNAVSELVRVYQFRDRSSICYYDISVTQCHAIDALLRLGPVSLNTLADDLHLDKSTASRVTNSLARKGYVRRLVDAADARALRLEVAPAGRALHRRIIRDLVGEMEGQLRDLDPAVRAATVALIARLASAATLRFARGEGAARRSGAGRGACVPRVAPRRRPRRP